MTKILAFSDIHAGGGPSSWSALFDRRIVGLFNYYYRRQYQHDQEWLKIAVNYISNDSPDIVICTGDIVTSGEPSELDLICNTLKPLVENPNFEFFYIPGNHDYYVENSKCLNALKKAFKYLNRGKFKLDHLPYALTIKGLDFCFVNESYPTHLVLSSGEMKKGTVKFISNWLLSEKIRPKVLVGHYPLLEPRTLFKLRHCLWGHKKIAKELKNKNIDLSICGHVHIPDANIDAKGRGEIIVGSITKNACLAEIKYDKNKDVFSYKKIKLDK